MPAAYIILRIYTSGSTFLAEHPESPGVLELILLQIGRHQVNLPEHMRVSAESMWKIRTRFPIPKAVYTPLKQGHLLSADSETIPVYSLVRAVLVTERNGYLYSRIVPICSS